MATTAAPPCPCVYEIGRQRACSSAPFPTAMWAAAFPDGGFRHRTRRGHRDREASAATNCCLPTASRATSRSSVSSPRPSPTAGLIIARPPGRVRRRTNRRTSGIPSTSGLRITAPQASPLAPAAERAGEIFPWFIHNALVHYLSPRGLEQYSGGGWGTRDVCQGPVELLLALGRFEPVRDLLLPRLPPAEPRRRLAAVVHVLRARAQHPPRRFAWRHRLLAAARPRPVSIRHRRRRAAG